MNTQVDVAPAILTAALKAVREFTSDDPTRNNLGAVFVRFTATDGHTLCSVEIECNVTHAGPAARLTEIAVETLLLGAKAAKGKELETFEIQDCTDVGPFPEYQRVVPETAEGKGERVHGFNGLYLARIGHVQKLLKTNKARVQLGEDSHAPMRADLQGDTVKATIVIMPVRM
jgi:hypothetical protein